MSGLMNMVSRFTRGTRTNSGRGRPAMHPGMGSRANLGGTAPRGRGAGGGGLESMARRLLNRSR
jgi:hypothetical protein